MRIISQKTVSNSFTATGVGLHSGVSGRVEVKPAPVGSGIQIQIANGAILPLKDATIARTARCTRIVDGEGNTLDTAEHLLASLVMKGITNCDIVCSGPEAPILDGCCDEWLALIAAAGLTDQDAVADHYVIARPCDYQDGVSRFRATPGTDRVTVSVDFPHPAIGRQVATAERDGFWRLASSRTFVLEDEINRLRASGLATGGSLDNALVIGASGPLNEGGFRTPDECARHKALDLIGDLFVCGYPIVGDIEAFKPGHAANSGFLAALLRSGCLRLVGREALANAA